MKHNAVRSISGEGMPTYKNPFLKGQLIIQFEVEFPESSFFTPEKIKVGTVLDL